MFSYQLRINSLVRTLRLREIEYSNRKSYSSLRNVHVKSFRFHQLQKPHTWPSCIFSTVISGLGSEIIPITLNHHKTPIEYLSLQQPLLLHSPLSSQPYLIQPNTILQSAIPLSYSTFPYRHRNLASHT